MTPADAAAIAKEVSTMWAVTARSFWDKASDERSVEARRVAEHFAGYLPARILAAVRDCAYEDAKRPPNPVQILERARAQQGHVPTLADPDTCAHPQPWAIVDERREGEKPLAPLLESHPVGTRVGMCLKCHTETVREPGRLLTQAEVDELKEAKRMARSG